MKLKEDREGSFQENVKKSENRECKEVEPFHQKISVTPQVYAKHKYEVGTLSNVSFLRYFNHTYTRRA